LVVAGSSAIYEITSSRMMVLLLLCDSSFSSQSAA
jgi:hypothetical protein